VRELSVAILRDGTHFATNNFTDMFDNPSKHNYTTENVFETTYGLTAYSSNSVTISWEAKPPLGLIADWVSSNAIIVVAVAETVAVLSAIYFRERKRGVRAWKNRSETHHESSQLCQN